MSPENPENLKIGLDAEKMGLDVGENADDVIYHEFRATPVMLKK